MERSVCVWIVLGILWISAALGQQLDSDDAPKVVSQCYRSQGFSFVSLYCGWNKRIRIVAAIHGRHKNPRIQHCGELREDCTVDMVGAYDWSKCDGKHSCVQMVKASGPEMGSRDRCSSGVHYLQVEYRCSPLSRADEKEEGGEEESTERRGKKIRKGSKKKAENETKNKVVEELHDICVNRTLSKPAGRSLLVHSPGYPEYYMASTDCRCAVQAPKTAQVAVTYHDLGLVKRGEDRCVDWLLLQSPGHKASTAVTCGRLPGNEPKTVLSKANWLLMHFHTSDGDGMKRRREGFKVEIQAVPAGKINVKCYSVHPDVLNSLKKGSDGDGLVLVATDLNAISTSEAITSGVSPSASLGHWSLFLALIAFYNTILVRAVLR